MKGQTMELRPEQKSIATALIAQACLLGIGDIGEPTEKAREATDAICQWTRGQPPDPHDMSDIIYDEFDRGLLDHEQQTKGLPSHVLWLTLAQALGYATWRAAMEEGNGIPSLVTEVREADFDELLDMWSDVSFRADLLARAQVVLAGGALDPSVVDVLSA
jgi:hypothetical protein